MKTHTPLFIIGLLIFVTPIVGLPDFTEMIVYIIYGIAIMLITSSHVLGCKECGGIVNSFNTNIYEDKNPEENNPTNEQEENKQE